MARWSAPRSSPVRPCGRRPLMRNPTTGQFEWTDAERQAFARVQELQREMNLTDASGGYIVPFTLDPAIRPDERRDVERESVALRGAHAPRGRARDRLPSLRNVGIGRRQTTSSSAGSRASTSSRSPSLVPDASMG